MTVTRKVALQVGGTVAGSLIASQSGFARAMAAQAGPSTFVLSGVTIVDTRDGSLQPNAAVTIAGGKITAIGAVASVAKDATTIDAHGTYLVPGYNDLHAHPLSSIDTEGSLSMMLANGVTGFREMAAWGAMLDTHPHSALMPEIPAPELLELGGPTLIQANSATPAVAVAEVRRQVAAGADFIKIIDYSPEVFYAVAAECKRSGTRFIGHLAPTVSPRDAATAGMRSIEHMGPRDSVLLGCSTDEAALRPTFVPSPPRPLPNGPVPKTVVERAVANPTITTTHDEFARYNRTMETYDEARCHDLALHFAKHGTWHVPTLIRVRTMALGDDPAYVNDPRLRYAPQQTTAIWRDVANTFTSKIRPDEHDTLKRLYLATAKMVKPFHDAGVPMMTGSDFGGGFVIAGYGLHDEFDRLAEVGLSPLDILQMTTRNGARFLGREATMGRVAVGQSANLVLLDANPLQSVQNMHKIAGVVRAGTFYPRAALEALKKRQADRVALGEIALGAVRPPCC